MVTCGISRTLVLQEIVVGHVRIMVRQCLVNAHVGKICISGKQSKREIKWLRLGKGQRR